MTTPTNEQLIDALYGETTAGSKRPASADWADDPTVRDDLAELRQLRGTLHAALKAPAPRPELRALILAEAEIELRLRETGDALGLEGLTDDSANLPGATGGHAGASGNGARITNLGPWLMASSAAMVLLAVTLAIAFDLPGVGRPESGTPSAFADNGKNRNAQQAVIVEPTANTPDHPADGIPAEIAQSPRGVDAARALNAKFPMVAVNALPTKGGMDYSPAIDTANNLAAAGNTDESSRLAWSIYRMAARDGEHAVQVAALDLLVQNSAKTKADDIAEWADDVMRDRFPEAWRMRRAMPVPEEDNGWPPNGWDERQSNAQNADQQSGQHAGQHPGQQQQTFDGPFDQRRDGPQEMPPPQQMQQQQAWPNQQSRQSENPVEPQNEFDAPGE